MPKTARINKKYSTNKTILNIGHLAKARAHAQARAFAKWSVWVKNQKCQKHAKDDSITTLELFCTKKPLQKAPNIQEMGRFWKSVILQRLYSPCKRYSLCKMVSLGKKLKMPKTCEKRFYENIRVVLCKEPLQKTSNIWEMTRFWKSTILQRL